MIRTHHLKTCLVPEERDPLGVAAERFDVLLDPLEQRDLVHQAEVGHARHARRVHVGVQETFGENDEVFTGLSISS